MTLSLTHKQKIKQSSTQIKQIGFSEAELIAGCRQEDAQCQRFVYEQFSPKMFVLCQRYVKNREDAKDVLHEGFIKVFTKIKNFRGDSKLETWITRIMINTALNAIKKELKTDLKNLEEIAEIPSQTDAELIEKDQLAALKLKNTIAMIQELPIGYRTILNLYAIENYSHQEIAEKLNISIGTSKSQLNRARKALKNKLGI